MVVKVTMIINFNCHYNITLFPSIKISCLTLCLYSICTERARTAKLVGASQECQVVAYAESVLDKTTKTQKAGEVLYTELENISFAAEIKKMKGDDMLLAEVRLDTAKLRIFKIIAELNILSFTKILFSCIMPYNEYRHT